MPDLPTAGQWMWQGQHEHTIDAKGRTSVPARFRDALSDEPRFVLTSSLDPCLVAYPLAEWRAFEEKLSQLPRFDPTVVKLRRIYVSAAVDVELDGQGRILVPPSLRSYASLEKEVLWAGMGNYAELWSRARWLRAIETSEDERRAMADKLSELGL